MRKNRVLALVGLGLAVGMIWPASPAVAQAQTPNRQPTPNRSSPMYWDVNIMVDAYVRLMTRQYNLTPEQAEYTRDLLSTRVKRFLTDYEKDVRWLASDVWDYQRMGEMPPPEIAKEWGARAKQLLPAIRQEILDGNMRWREILNPEQQAKHDKDLEALRNGFDRWDQIVDRWSNGEISPSDFEANPSAVSRRPLIPRPSEDAWEQIVKMFIETYKLDEGQQKTAFSILRQLKEEAQRYREAHKDEFTKLDADDRVLTTSPPKTDPDEIKRTQEATRERTQRRRQLEQPIAEMFARLKSKLNELPTVEQRRARDKQLARLLEIGKRGASQPATVAVPTGTQPTTMATTKPAH